MKSDRRKLFSVLTVIARPYKNNTQRVIIFVDIVDQSEIIVNVYSLCQRFDAQDEEDYRN